MFVLRLKKNFISDIPDMFLICMKTQTHLYHYNISSRSRYFLTINDRFAIFIFSTLISDFCFEIKATVYHFMISWAQYLCNRMLSKFIGTASLFFGVSIYLFNPRENAEQRVYRRLMTSELTFESRWSVYRIDLRTLDPANSMAEIYTNLSHENPRERECRGLSIGAAYSSHQSSDFSHVRAGAHAFLHFPPYLIE